MTEQTNNVVMINGKEYDTNSFDQQQKYIINQLRDLQQKGDSLKFQLDQVAAAQKIFTDALIESVESAQEEPQAVAN